MSIILYNPFSTSSSRQGANLTFVENGTGTNNDFYISWSGNAGSYWQMEWKQRSRYAYAGQPEESWTAWGNWTATYTTYTPTAVVYENRLRYTTKLSLAATDFTGTYDAQQFLVRVRSCNSSGTNTGEWEEATLTVYFSPDWSISSATLDPDTKVVTLTIAPGYTRPARGFKVPYFWNGTKPVNCKPHLTDFTLDGSGNIIVVVPAQYGRQLPVTGAKVDGIETIDIQGVQRRKTFDLSYEDPSAYIAVPANATFTDGDTATAVSVPHASASGDLVAYQSVVAAYAYTDARGKYVAGSVDLVKDGTKWVGDIPSLPYGVAVTIDITANGVKSDIPVYNTKTYTHTTARCKYYTLTYGTEYFWLGYDLSFSRQTDISSTIIQLASGRNVARHGHNNLSKLNLSGVIVDAALQSTFGASSKWLPDVETLQEPHDWVLRTPLGERYQIACTGATRAQKHGRYAEVTVEMEEVG